MIVGMDFDDTYTADPEAMDAVISALIQHGHRVVIVTGRGDHHRPLAESVMRSRWDGEVAVVRANRNPLGKYVAALEAGYEVDVWIDDEPWGITPTSDKRAERKRAQRHRSQVGRRGIRDFGEYMRQLRADP